MYKVTLLPEGRVAEVADGCNLLEALSLAGYMIEAPCGGAGGCGKCKVHVEGPTAGPDAVEESFLSESELASGCRLACRVLPQGDLRLSFVDSISQSADKPINLQMTESLSFNPSVIKQAVRVESASLSRQTAHDTRLREALHGDAGEATIGPEILRQLAKALKVGDCLTAVTAGKGLIAVERGDTAAFNFGIAVDIGTTTLVAYLVDLHKERLVAAMSATNPQASFGADVITRMDYGSRNGGGDALRNLVIDAINALIISLADDAGVDLKNIYEVAVVGNTPMIHIFWGLETSTLSTAPYNAVAGGSISEEAAEVGLNICGQGSVFSLPNIAGFVGADTVGLMMACGLDRSDALQLAIDIGTNGEMLLGNRERLLACSTAAGPAFEGARISQGMRAIEGAIDRVWIEDGDLCYSVIRAAAPLGFCGSGIIDAVAALRRGGAIDEGGRILSSEEMPAEFRALADRISGEGAGRGIEFYSDGGSRSLRLTQRDIREVQLAKAAICAGVKILLSQYGVSPDNLEAILLAGAFGNYIDKRSAIDIGLLPGVNPTRIKSVGNAAGLGAVMSLASSDVRRRADEVARRVEYVELALSLDFQMEFAEAMIFPPVGSI